MTISWNTAIFKFRWIFGTGERRIVAGQAFHMVFCGSPLIRGNKRNTEQWASTGQRMDCLSRQNSSLIGPKNPAKFENYCISRNVHRFQITQSNLTILLSFSSAEDVLSNDVKIYDIFGLQGTENPPFRFFWDTRYVLVHQLAQRTCILCSQILKFINYQLEELPVWCLGRLFDAGFPRPCRMLGFWRRPLVGHTVPGLSWANGVNLVVYPPPPPTHPHESCQIHVGKFCFESINCCCGMRFHSVVVLGRN